MTTLPRPDRRNAAIGLTAAALAGLAVPRAALGQTSGIEILAAGAPGEGQDQLARAIAEGLGSTKLTPRAIPANAPGDVEGLAEFVAGKRPRAAMMVVSLSTVGALIADMAPATLDDCRPLARLIGEPLPIVVQTESRFRGLGDLMAALRDDPGAVVFAGRIRGSADHQLVLMLAAAAGADASKIVYAPFDSSAQVSTELLRGKAAVATGALAEFLQQIRGGTFRALGLASPERMPGVDIATLDEQGVAIAQVNWRGVVTREAVGDALIDRFGKALVKLTQLEGWRQLLSQRHWLDLHQSEADFTLFLADERKRVAALLKRAA